jgi:hypothetical protein
MNGCVDYRKVANARHLLTSRLIELAERLLVAGRRNTLASHIAGRTKSDDWHVDHQLTNGGHGNWVDACQNTRLKNVWPVSARRILDTFPRTKLHAYFEDKPVYPSGPPRRVSGGCTQQNAV